MTLRITASAASQICLLADTFSDLIQIISDNENLGFYSRAIFKAYRGCWVGTPENAYLITFLITNVICPLHPSLKKPSNCGFLGWFSSGFQIQCYTSSPRPSSTSVFRGGPGKRATSLFRGRNALEILLSTYSRQYINCLIGEPSCCWGL